MEHKVQQAYTAQQEMMVQQEQQVHKALLAQMVLTPWMDEWVLDLAGAAVEATTGVGFLDHLLTLLAFHAGPEMAGHRATHQHRQADAFYLRTRHQRGLQAAHVDRDEVMGRGVHEPTIEGARSACESGGRPPISALTLKTSIGSNRGSLPARFGPKCCAPRRPDHSYDRLVPGVDQAMRKQRPGDAQALHKAGQAVVIECTTSAQPVQRMRSACTTPDQRLHNA